MHSESEDSLDYVRAAVKKESNGGDTGVVHTRGPSQHAGG